MKIYQYIAGFFALVAMIAFLVAGWYKIKNERLESENIGLKTQVKNYKSQLEKEHNDKVELNKKYKQLEIKAEADKNFDWNADISSSPVLQQLCE